MQLGCRQIGSCSCSIQYSQYHQYYFVYVSVHVCPNLMVHYCYKKTAKRTRLSWSPSVDNNIIVIVIIFSCLNFSYVLCSVISCWIIMLLLQFSGFIDVWQFDISLRFVQLNLSLVLAVFVLGWSFWRNFTLQKWFMCPSLLGVRISELHDWQGGGGLAGRSGTEFQWVPQFKRL